jgi:CrcB protein
VTDQPRAATALPLVAVLAGGAVGTGLRLAVDLALPHSASAFPLGTLLVNVAGSLLLGALVARVWPVAPTWLRAGLGVGVLGSFTTFSALAVSVVTLTEAGAGAVALGYVALSLVGGILAAALGIRLARRPTPIGPQE